MEKLEVADLGRVFIRAQDKDGKWKSMSALEVSNKQFDAWARTRMQVAGEGTNWELADRADFCNALYQARALHILTKDAAFGEPVKGE